MYSQGVVDALVESNEFLQEEVSRLRNNNRMLRTVISAQRKTATVLRDQVAIAAANDEAFKEMCQEEPLPWTADAATFDAAYEKKFGVPVVQGESGLLDATDTVESTI